MSGPIEQYVTAAAAALPWGDEHLIVEYSERNGVTMPRHHTTGEILIRDVLAWAARTGLLRTTPSEAPTWEEVQALAQALADASDHPRFTQAAGWRQLTESKDMVVMALNAARRASCGPQEVARVEDLAQRLMQWHRRPQGA